MRRRGPGLLLLAIAAAGCRSPQERIEESRRGLRSWAATLRLGAEQAEAGQLSRAFRRELVRSAKRELGNEAGRLRKLAGSGGGREADTLAATAERLAEAAPAIAADGPAGGAAPFSAIERDLAEPGR